MDRYKLRKLSKKHMVESKWSNPRRLPIVNAYFEKNWAAQSE